MEKRTVVKHGESRDDFFLGKGKKVLEIKAKKRMNYGPLNLI